MNLAPRFTRPRNLGLASGALVFLVLIAAPARSTSVLPPDPPITSWNQTELVLGTVDGPCLKSHGLDPGDPEYTSDLARLQVAKDLGIDMTWLMPRDSWYPNVFDQDYMQTVMSLRDLETWVPGGRYVPSWWSQAWNVDTANAIIFKAKNQSPSRRAAQFGYLVADEPDSSDSTYVKNWVAQIHAMDPERPSFVAVGGMGPLEPGWMYTGKLDFWFNDADPAKRPDILAFSNYPFSNEYDVCSNGGMSKRYFETLGLARDRARGRPLWTYVSTQKWRSNLFISEDPDSLCGQGGPQVIDRMEVTPGTLRFQMYTALAYGVKGLLYWSYLQPARETDDSSDILPGQQILTDCETKSPWKYDEIQRNNAFIHDFVAPAVMNGAWIGAFHKGNSTLEENFDSLLTLQDAPVVLNTNNDRMLFGLFAGPSNTQYLLVVNKDWSGAIYSPVAVHLRGDYRNLVELSPSPAVYQGAGQWTPVTTTYNATLNRTSFQIPFMDTGEGLLVRLFKDGVPPAAYGLSHSIQSTSLTFSWVVPGDDMMSNGPATSYEIRSSTSPLTAVNFASGSLVASGSVVGDPWDAQETIVEVGWGSPLRHYAIRFTDDAGNASTVAENTPLIGTPAITDLAACFASRNCVRLAWSTPVTGVQYDVRLSTTPITPANADGAGAGTPPPVPVAPGHMEYSMPGLTQGTTYWVAMRLAEVGGQYGAWSNVVEFTTPTTGASCGDYMCESGFMSSPMETDVAAPRWELKLAPPVPNPSREEVTLRYSVPAELAGESLTLDAFDIGGRLVARIARGRAVAGESSTRWDLLDRGARRVHAGFYVVRLSIGERELRRPLVVK